MRWIVSFAIVSCWAIAGSFLDARQPPIDQELEQAKLKKLEPLWDILPQDQQQRKLAELTRGMAPRQREAIEQYFRALTIAELEVGDAKLDPAVVAKFRQLVADWGKLTPRQRREALDDLTLKMTPSQRDNIETYFRRPGPENPLRPSVEPRNETRLFNGKDLTGWDTWLGKPFKGDKAVGLNTDPSKVYTVADVDGKPAIRISGEIFGALTTKEEYENYHFTVEFKWGEKRWPPREKAVRDSGLLYHCVGPQGAQGTFWMRSQEMQIQEKDCGDYWSVAGAIIDVEAERKDGKGPLIYKKGAKSLTFGTKENGSRVVKDPDNEKPTGQWNTIELYCFGQTSVHMVNGKVNMILTNSRQIVDKKEVPLTKGRIQLQSEGAEVYYRNITIRPIKAIPAELLK